MTNTFVCLQNELNCNVLFYLNQSFYLINHKSSLVSKSKEYIENKGKNIKSFFDVWPLQIWCLLNQIRIICSTVAPFSQQTKGTRRNKNNNIPISFENMKTWAICLLAIFVLIVTVPVEGRNYIGSGVISPCSGPNPLSGCNPPPVPANRYNRGCFKFTRCDRDLAWSSSSKFQSDVLLYNHIYT